MITVDHLTKRYGRHAGRRRRSFTCEPGTVTGFLGPERRRQVHHHADDLRAHPARPAAPRRSPAARTGELPNPGREVGVLLDASAQHAGRTGREVLTLAAAHAWAWTAARVDETLDRVGLNAVGGRSAGSGRTRWACGSGSASRTRCSATRGC